MNHATRHRARRSLAAPALVAAMLLAGCLGEAPAAVDEAATSPTPTVEIDESRPDTSFGNVTTGPEAAADVAATLDAPPVLVPGEWWRIRFASGLDGAPVEAVRVVAAVEDEGYVIGMPHEGWFKEAVAYHSPGLGDIALDLSYRVHNEVFQPVRFPLVEGATWETSFALTPYAARVESVEGTRATIVLTPTGEPDPISTALSPLLGGGDASMRVVYDASIHEVARFESPIGSYEVVAHGYGFEGWVTIPRGQHTAIDYGNFGPATPGEPPVTRTIEVSGGFNRLTLMHFIMPMSPGVYRVRAVAPDGSEFVTEHVAATEMAIRFYEAANPDGAWKTEDVVGGAGFTYSMGISYHQYDIRLPDGAKRSDHSHEVVR